MLDLQLFYILERDGGFQGGSKAFVCPEDKGIKHIGGY